MQDFIFVFFFRLSVVLKNKISSESEIISWYHRQTLSKIVLGILKTNTPFIHFCYFVQSAKTVLDTAEICIYRFLNIQHSYCDSTA